MRRIALTYGTIAGVILSIFFVVSFSMLNSNLLNFENSELVGYLAMFIALSTIFFGIKAYRDRNLGGYIGFGKAFVTGLYITFVASVFYVATWLLVSNFIAPDFMSQYYEHSVQELYQSGMAQEEIDAEITRMDDFKELYKNPFVKIAITFLEVFPVGLFITLVCTFILMKQQPKAVFKEQSAAG